MDQCAISNLLLLLLLLYDCLWKNKGQIDAFVILLNSKLLKHVQVKVKKIKFLIVLLKWIGRNSKVLIWIELNNPCHYSCPFCFYCTLFSLFVSLFLSLSFSLSLSLSLCVRVCVRVCVRACVSFPLKPNPVFHETDPTFFYALENCLLCVYIYTHTHSRLMSNTREKRTNNSLSLSRFLASILLLSDPPFAPPLPPPPLPKSWGDCPHTLIPAPAFMLTFHGWQNKSMCLSVWLECTAWKRPWPMMIV